jgi:hypothetical protein
LQENPNQGSDKNIFQKTMGLNFGLKRLFAAEQISFLRRSRKHWGRHLGQAREFFGAALQNADPSRKALILGAGWGLEIPWRHAPKGTAGWDADPLSRLGTFLRHLRWAPWIFEDITGALKELNRVSRRVQMVEGTYIYRPAEVSAKRLAGLLPSVSPKLKPLENWLRDNEPSTIICANMLGQIKPVAYKIVEKAFGKRSPWIDDQDLEDPLQDALDAWSAKTAKAILAVLRTSGSNLCLLHDRGVIHQDTDLALGEWADPWTKQLRSSDSSLEASDPMPGVDVLEELKALNCLNKARWIWPLGPGQIHVVEALEFGGR